MSSLPDLQHPKIVSRQELAPLLAALQNEGKRIVFTNGCFDIVHPGHVDLLHRAAELGDILVLGLNTDESVRRLGKAPDRPINPLPVRAFVLAHLASVDFVCPFDEDTPYELVNALQPDVLVKGGDWAKDAIVGKDIVEARGGQIFSLPLIPGFSTTDLVAKIRGSS